MVPFLCVCVAPLPVRGFWEFLHIFNNYFQSNFFFLFPTCVTIHQCTDTLRFFANKTNHITYLTDEKIFHIWEEEKKIKMLFDWVLKYKISPFFCILQIVGSLTIFLFHFTAVLCWVSPTFFFWRCPWCNGTIYQPLRSGRIWHKVNF